MSCKTREILKKVNQLIILWRTYDQENGGEEQRLHAHIQIKGERDTEVIGVCKQLSAETGPLFGYLANTLVVCAVYL